MRFPPQPAGHFGNHLSGGPTSRDRNHRTRRSFIGVLLGATVLSCTVVYPLIHEGGHYITARMFGVDVHGAVWTMWAGHPRVSLGNTPGFAIPWINAGGLLLPTLIGTTLALFWIATCRRLHWIPSIAVAVFAVNLLMGNLGLIIEVIVPSGFKHMRVLAEHLGLSGFTSVFFQLLPALVASVLMAAMVVRLHGTQKMNR